jgi:hypothetical protein
MLTQREAAAACGVSRTTTRGRREAGELPHAVLDPDRGWLIPVDDLTATGLQVNSPAPNEFSATDPTGLVGGQASQQGAPAPRNPLGREQLERRALAAEVEHGRRLAEAEASHLRKLLADRGEHLGDLRMALAAAIQERRWGTEVGPAVALAAGAAVAGYLAGRIRT